MLVFLFIFTNVYAQDKEVTCFSDDCVLNFTPEDEYKKVYYNSVDVGQDNQDFIFIKNEKYYSPRDIRLAVENNKIINNNLNMSVDLSAKTDDVNSANTFLIFDYFKNLSIYLNGYEGSVGKSASQICAENFLGGRYGLLEKAEFQSKRIADSTVPADRCTFSDVDYLQRNKFTCGEDGFEEILYEDPLVQVKRFKGKTKCIGVGFQDVCLAKTVKVTCRWKLKYVEPSNLIGQYSINPNEQESKYFYMKESEWNEKKNKGMAPYLCNGLTISDDSDPVSPELIKNGSFSKNFDHWDFSNNVKWLSKKMKMADGPKAFLIGNRKLNMKRWCSWYEVNRDSVAVSKESPEVQLINGRCNSLNKDKMISSNFNIHLVDDSVEQKANIQYVELENNRSDILKAVETNSSDRYVTYRMEVPDSANYNTTISDILKFRLIDEQGNQNDYAIDMKLVSYEYDRNSNTSTSHLQQFCPKQWCGKDGCTRHWCNDRPLRYLSCSSGLGALSNYVSQATNRSHFALHAKYVDVRAHNQTAGTDVSNLYRNRFGPNYWFKYDHSYNSTYNKGWIRTSGDLRRGCGGDYLYLVRTRLLYFYAYAYIRRITPPSYHLSQTIPTQLDKHYRVKASIINPLEENSYSPVSVQILNQDNNDSSIKILNQTVTSNGGYKNLDFTFKAQSYNSKLKFKMYNLYSDNRKWSGYSSYIDNISFKEISPNSGPSNSTSFAKFYLSAEGSGANRSSQLVINDNKVNFQFRRGWNTFLLNDAFDVIESRNFDTYGSSSNATALRDYLSSLPENSLVAFGTYDEPYSSVYNNTGLINEFKRFGATESIIRGMNFRSAYLLVGMKKNSGGLKLAEKYKRGSGGFVEYNGYLYFPTANVAGELGNGYYELSDTPSSERTNIGYNATDFSLAEGSQWSVNYVEPGGRCPLYYDKIKNNHLATHVDYDGNDALCDDVPLAQDPEKIIEWKNIGFERDKSFGIEELNCNMYSCPVKSTIENTNVVFDNLSTSNGTNGTEQGEGFVFAYDIQSINSSSKIGRSGLPGIDDLPKLEDTRLCVKVQDYVNEGELSDFAKEPFVTFRVYDWRALLVDDTSDKGKDPEQTKKKITILKKLDSSVRYLLKKEFL